MTCIYHRNHYRSKHTSLFPQDETCYPGLGDAIDLCHLTFSPLRDDDDSDEVSSHTAAILLLTAYGMTEQVIHGHHGAHWVGYPIMRFIHPGHVQRLCGGLSEASKSGRAVAIPFITCVLDPFSAITTTLHIVVTPVKACRDDHNSGFYCVLFSEHGLVQEQRQRQQQGEQYQQEIAVATFMVLVRQAVAWLSTSPLRILVWVVTLLFLQRKKEV